MADGVVSLVTRAENLPTASATQNLSRTEALSKLRSASALAKRLAGIAESEHLQAGLRRGVAMGTGAAGAAINGAARSILQRRGVSPIAVETTPLTYVGIGGIVLSGLAIGMGHTMGPMVADALLGLGTGAMAPDIAAWTQETLDAAAARRAAGT